LKIGKDESFAIQRTSPDFNWLQTKIKAKNRLTPFFPVHIIFASTIWARRYFSIFLLRVRRRNHITLIRRINLTRISCVRFSGIDDCPRRLCKSLIGKDINKLSYFFGAYNSSDEYILGVIFGGLLFIFGTALFLYKNDFTFQEIKTRGTYLLFIIGSAVPMFLNTKSYIKCRKDNIFSNKSLKRGAAKTHRAP
jgi:hypothetical protein